MSASIVVHADWGTHPRKRWLAQAVRGADGRYRAHASEMVGEAGTLLRRLREAAGDGAVVVGFDFPIGVPAAYAARAGIARLPDVLAGLGDGEWAEFYLAATRPEEIGVRRPFYPQRPGGTRQMHLIERTGWRRSTTCGGGASWGTQDGGRRPRPSSGRSGRSRWGRRRSRAGGTC